MECNYCFQPVTNLVSPEGHTDGCPVVTKLYHAASDPLYQCGVTDACYDCHVGLDGAYVRTRIDLPSDDPFVASGFFQDGKDVGTSLCVGCAATRVLLAA